MSKIEVTVEDVARAMIADKTPKVQGTLLVRTRADAETRQVPVGARCVIGGAAAVLGLNAGALFTALYKVPVDGLTRISLYGKESVVASSAIWRANDNTEMSKAEIGEAILLHGDAETLATKLLVKEKTK